MTESSKVPSYLRSLVMEGGGDPEARRDELLLALVDEQAEQNAILDDTLYEELRKMREAEEKQAEALKDVARGIGELTNALEIIGDHTRFIGAPGS